MLQTSPHKHNPPGPKPVEMLRQPADACDPLSNVVYQFGAAADPGGWHRLQDPPYSSCRLLTVCTGPSAGPLLYCVKQNHRTRRAYFSTLEAAWAEAQHQMELGNEEKVKKERRQAVKQRHAESSRSSRRGKHGDSSGMHPSATTAQHIAAKRARRAAAYLPPMQQTTSKTHQGPAPGTLLVQDAFLQQLAGTHIGSSASSSVPAPTSAHTFTPAQVKWGMAAGAAAAPSSLGAPWASAQFAIPDPAAAASVGIATATAAAAAASTGTEYPAHPACPVVSSPSLQEAPAAAALWPWAGDAAAAAAGTFSASSIVPVPAALHQGPPVSAHLTAATAASTLGTRTPPTAAVAHMHHPQQQQQQQQQQQRDAEAFVAMATTHFAPAAAAAPPAAQQPAAPAPRPASAVLTAKQLDALPDLVDFAGLVLDVGEVYSNPLKGKRVQLLEIIGVGTCCTVYKGLLVPCSGVSAAAPPRKQVFVAVKVYCVPSGDPAARAMLQQTTDKELGLLTELAQPVGGMSHIVQLYGTGVMRIGGSSSSSIERHTSSSSYRFAVLELLGKSLNAHFTSSGPARPSGIKALMWQLVHAVSLLHNHPSYKIIHRDLKPANILLVPGTGPRKPDVKVVDFNCCAVIDKSQLASTTGSSSSGSSMNRSSHTSPHTRQSGGTDTLLLRSLVGSDFYMAPEVAALFDADEAAAAVLPGYNEKVDVYALGAIAMTMAAGGASRLQELQVAPPGVRRSRHNASLLSRFASGKLLLGSMTGDNMQEYEGLRQFVGACCMPDPLQRPSVADLQRRGVGPAWLHELN